MGVAEGSTVDSVVDSVVESVAVSVAVGVAVESVPVRVAIAWKEREETGQELFDETKERERRDSLPSRS